MSGSVDALMRAIYRIDTDPESWQRGVAREIARLYPEARGILAYEFDFSDPGRGVSIGNVAAVGDIGGFSELTRPVHADVSAELYRRIMEGLGTHSGTTFEAAERLGIDDELLGPILGALDTSGYADIWAVCGVNPDAVGIAFAAPLAGEETLPDRRIWTRIGVHIAAAHRMLRRFGGAGPEAGTEGIFGADGTPLELQGRTDRAREKLSRMIQAIDRARSGEYRRGGELSVDLWQGLLNGRWSLVEQIDSDGTRFYLVVENDPEAAGPSGLTRRERQVATYAAQGHMNKEIAYELGIAVSTVASHLSSALTRLNLSSRTELAWIYGELRGR